MSWSWIICSGQKIPFYIGVYDLNRHQTVFLDGTKETFNLLKASASSPPFYPESVKVFGRDFIDVDVNVSATIKKVIIDNPDKKIIYVVNNKKNLFKVIISLPFEFFRYLMMSFRFGVFVSTKYLLHTFKYFRLKKFRHLDNFFPVINHYQYFNFLTDRKRLIKVYEEGIRQGQEVLRKI